MKKIKVIIMGSTGMIGKGVLLECIDSEHVESILVINRSSVEVNDPKVCEVIHSDFTDYSTISEQMKEYDACFFCLGVSAAGMSEEKYHHITYEMTVNCGEAFKSANPDGTFIYISGAGTDSSEKGRSMWARVKGKTENKLLDMGFKYAYMFRPGLIQPMRGIKSRTTLYNVVYTMLTPFYPLFRKMKGAYTNTDRVGRAMIYASIEGYSKKVLEMRDINELAERTL